MSLFKRYAINLGVSLNQLFNTILGGDPDEMLSARMGKDIAAGRCWLCRPICWLLDKIDKDHCAKAAKGDESEGKHSVAPW